MLVSLNDTMKAYSKGEKSFKIISITTMGKSVSKEQGFEGQQEWELKPVSKCVRVFKPTFSLILRKIP